MKILFMLLFCCVSILHNAIALDDFNIDSQEINLLIYNDYGSCLLTFSDTNKPVPSWTMECNILWPGDSLKFKIEYISTKLGMNRASMTTISEGETDVTSNWNVTGVTPFIENNENISRYLKLIINPLNINLKFSFILSEPGFANLTVTDFNGKNS